ncbi:MAG: KUP/HAK/KT family potassium transporter, partial [Bradyrhizobium sp.]|nr:KUP/HAK/KT family potassium transporter [Bradyrhizobium sp.]
GAITPAISVLSAVKGLKVDAPMLGPAVLPLIVVILVALFVVQSRGTGFIGSIFGPVMVAWFAVLALLGLLGIARAPGVLAAVSPTYALSYLLHASPAASFAVLGAVFLAVTGGEAMYADMGHFGCGAIRLAWFAVVMPGLVLNYLGQGALLLTDPAAIVNPFYQLCPDWAHYPLVAFATAATVIASAATLVAVLEFGSSDALAGAYGIAVSQLMAITTLLAALVAMQWGYNPVAVVTLNGFFLVVDLLFFAANSTKLFEGGWFPLLLAFGIAFLMVTWRTGQRLAERARIRRRLPEQTFLRRLAENPPVRLPGTAIVLTPAADGIPLSLTHHLKHNRVMHERLLLVSVLTTEDPRVPQEGRVEVRDLAGGISRVILRYGFMETPHVPGALKR